MCSTLCLLGLHRWHFSLWRDDLPYEDGYPLAEVWCVRAGCEVRSLRHHLDAILLWDADLGSDNLATLLSAVQLTLQDGRRTVTPLPVS